MSEKEKQRDEYNFSANEFETPSSDYDSHRDEFGSLPKSEFNECQEEIKIKPKRSKFKRMMRYFVAGVVSLVMITEYGNNIVPENDNVDNIPIIDNEVNVEDNVEDKVESDKEESFRKKDLYFSFQLQEYTIYPREEYVIEFRRESMEEYYQYLAELVYEIVSNITDDDLKYFEDNQLYIYYHYDEAPQLAENNVYSDAEGIYSSYDTINFTSDKLFGKYNSIRVQGRYIIRFKSDEDLKYIQRMVKKFGGMTKQEILEVLKVEYVYDDIIVNKLEFCNSYTMNEDGSVAGYTSNVVGDSSELGAGRFLGKHGDYTTKLPQFLTLRKIEQ